MYWFVNAGVCFQAQIPVSCCKLENNNVINETLCQNKTSPDYYYDTVSDTSLFMPVCWSICLSSHHILWAVPLSVDACLSVSLSVQLSHTVSDDIVRSCLSFCSTITPFSDPAFLSNHHTIVRSCLFFCPTITPLSDHACFSVQPSHHYQILPFYPTITPLSDRACFSVQPSHHCQIMPVFLSNHHTIIRSCLSFCPIMTPMSDHACLSVQSWHHCQIMPVFLSNHHILWLVIDSIVSSCLSVSLSPSWSMRLTGC